jgi:DNA-binding transcriptional LysR family regulator
MASELQGGKARQIRIGASTIVLREHLPEVFQNVRRRFPNLKILLREGYPMEFENLLQKEELDLAVTTIEKKPAPGLHSVALVKLPLVLLIPKSSGVTAASQLWQQDKIEEPLICLPAAEAICKNFQRGLARLGVDWFPSMEVSSLDLIETYVANGFGIGLSVAVPQTKLAPNVRVAPLPDFAPVVLGVLWRGKTSALLQAFLDEFQLRSKRFPQLTPKET